MYEFVNTPNVKKSRRGGAKTPERLAIENLPPGMSVYIPKKNAPQGSMAAWSWKIGKERGLHIGVHTVGDDWLVTAEIKIDQ